MKTVHKFLVPSPFGAVAMPKDSTILAIQLQGDKAYMWVQVDTDKAEIVRHFRIVGTGHTIQGRETYVGTWQEVTDGCCFVWHLYELPF